MSLRDVTAQLVVCFVLVTRYRYVYKGCRSQLVVCFVLVTRYRYVYKGCRRLNSPNLERDTLL